MASGIEAAEELANIALFADLSPAELEKVGQAFEERYFEIGERAQRQGFVGTAFHVILEGEAQWRVDDRPIERTATSLIGTKMLMLKRGDYFGELSIFFREPAISDVIAFTPMRTIALPGAELEPFLMEHPKMMFRMLVGEARLLRDPLRWQ